MEHELRIWSSFERVLQEMHTSRTLNHFWKNRRISQSVFFRVGSISSKCLRAAFTWKNRRISQSVFFPSRVNFINMLTCSFYVQRSQKHKKAVKSSVEKKLTELVLLLYFSGFALLRCALKFDEIDPCLLFEYIHKWQQRRCVELHRQFLQRSFHSKRRTNAFAANYSFKISLLHWGWKKSKHFLMDLQSHIP